MKTQSNFKDTFIDIVYNHVNNEAYPNLTEDALASLRELFYVHLENCILISILKYADEDVISVYKAWQNTQLQQGKSPESFDSSFNYASFDILVDLMVVDNELKAKVDAEIEQFAQEFAKYAHNYLD